MPTPTVEWTITLPDTLTVRQALSLMAAFGLTAEHSAENRELVFYPRRPSTQCPTRAAVNRAMNQPPPPGLAMRHTT